jgi:hypothetical protein
MTMTTRHQAPQLGAPDPERRNSPIFDRWDNDELSFDSELESSGCYFNDRQFAIGEYVRSGDELLHCTERGIWLKVTEEHLT